MSTDSVVFDIDASPEEVWRVTGEQWGEVHRLIPRISNSVLTSDDGVREGATRRCTLSESTAGLEEIDERLVFMDPPETFTYELLDPPFPLQRLTNTWAIEPTDTGTRLTLRPLLELRGRPFTTWLEGFALRRMMADLEDDQQAMKGAIEAAVAELD